MNFVRTNTQHQRLLKLFRSGLAIRHQRLQGPALQQTKPYPVDGRCRARVLVAEDTRIPPRANLSVHGKVAIASQKKA